MTDANLRGSHSDTVLVHAVLSYLSHDLTSSDPRAARAFGLNPEMAKRVMELSTSEVMLLARRAAHCISIKINTEAFGGLLQAVDEENEKEASMHQCIQLDASRDMMVALFGITNRRYALLRQMNGLPPGNGRSRECSEDDAEQIFEALEKRGWKRDPGSLIAIAKELGISLRHVWEELQKYAEVAAHPARQRSA